jgi:hypothetical protein
MQHRLALPPPASEVILTAVGRDLSDVPPPSASISFGVNSDRNSGSKLRPAGSLSS